MDIKRGNSGSKSRGFTVLLGSTTAIIGNPKARFTNTRLIQTPHQGCALAEPGGP